MLFVDTILRYSSITLLFLLAALACRDARHLVQGRIVIILGLTLGCMLLTTAPENLRPPSPAYEALRVFDTPNIVFIWWFGLSLFEDDFKLRRLHWAGLGIYLLCGIPLRIEYLANAQVVPFALDVAGRVVSIAMLGHLFWNTFSGWQDDLIEARRRTRLWYVIATAIAASLVLGTEIIYTTFTGDRSDPEWFSTLRTAIIFPPVAFGAFLYMQFRSEFLLFEPVSRLTPAKPAIDPKDQATHTRLVATMEDDKLYREHGLGIGDLAAKLGVPEHQLRALINKGLGYRNFAAFLNQYRLAEAKAALADPEQARTPILTIAMDVGYASLATFNRAFKSEEATTPSQYRAEALAKAAQT
jgi:AraC-like DNA-binding protein